MLIILKVKYLKGLCELKSMLKSKKYCCITHRFINMEKLCKIILTNYPHLKTL